jgi:hypothetical protein
MEQFVWPGVNRMSRAVGAQVDPVPVAHGRPRDVVAPGEVDVLQGRAEAHLVRHEPLNWLAMSMAFCIWRIRHVSADPQTSMAGQLRLNQGMTRCGRSGSAG